MSCKLVSGTETQFQLGCKSYQPTNHATLGFCSRLSLGTRMPTPGVSVKRCNATGPYRTVVRANSVATYCETTETTETLYNLLGIPQSGSLSEIKQAYKQLARKYHPDVSPPDRVEENTRRFIMVKKAYDTLSDPNSRALYDRMHLQLQNEWQSQIHDIKRRSMNKNHNKVKASWGARMKRR